jgi:5,10-methylene-tetrahydrofolate dehydrogenase/methenyl tetrahydrofolate cyclohydrolase
MIVDGKGIAEEMYWQLSGRRVDFDRAARLGIVVTGVDAVIESFVGIKKSAAKRLAVEIIRIDLDGEAGSKEVIEAIEALSPKVDGLIVQLPLPERVDVNATLSTIPDDKDVDAISTAGGEHFVEAPVALAVVEILRSARIDLKGKRAVVVGAGRLVGVPTAKLLQRLGANVSLLTLEQGTLSDLKEADIVVSGVGNPRFIKPEMLKHGVALLDAGTSEAGGKVVGDCDPRCAEVASVFTPVPGGVGPVAVAMIFKNLFDLMRRTQG